MARKLVLVCLAASLWGCGNGKAFESAEDGPVVYACIEGQDCGGSGGAAGTPGSGGETTTGGAAGTPGSGGTPTGGAGTSAGGDAGSDSSGGNAGTSGFGGDAGAPSGGSAGNGGAAGSSGSAGSPSGGTAGNGGDTGTGGTAGSGGTSGDGGTGGSNPCPDITFDEVSTLVGEPCGNLFPTGCSTQNPVPRGEFITVVINSVPDKLEGYTDPDSATFGDIPITHAAEKAVWLELIPATSFFQPDGATTTCFAEDVMDDVAALPDIYAIIFNNQADSTIPSTNGMGTVTRMYVYGTSPANHLTGVVRLVNNLDEPPDFTVPQATTALEAVSLRCQVPEGGGNYVSYSGPIASGSADLTVDCHIQTGDTMELQIQIDPDPSGAGHEAQIGIDPTTLTIRRGSEGVQETNPRKTIQ